MPPVERILAWAVALACVAVGGTLLLGLHPPDMPRSLRIGCGVVLVLLGIKRFVVTRLQSRTPAERYFDDPRS